MPYTLCVETLPTDPALAAEILTAQKEIDEKDDVRDKDVL